MNKSFSSEPVRERMGLEVLDFRPQPMPPPQKCYKIINHRDVQYRWIMQNLSGCNELRVEANAAVTGQVLLAELPRVVNDGMLTGALDFALANGWRPNEPHPPFRCKYSRRGFLLPDA